MRLTVLYDIIILGHCITIFPGHCVIINLGHCLSGLYTMRLVGMGVVDPVYPTIRKRCFHTNISASSVVEDKKFYSLINEYLRISSMNPLS